MKKRIKLFTLLFITSVLISNTNAQVTIGSGEKPDESALLDLKQNVDGTSQKGFLGPRVALESITDQQTVLDPANGLLVYNTGEGDLMYIGYVYWNGSEWRALNSGSLAPGVIGSITCNAVQLTPSVYEAGKEYEGTMIVPYVGGNGGVYEAQTLGPINGLTATLASGNFSAGAGNLAYTIKGIPTVTTPEVTTFPIVIGGQTCQAIIGAGDGIAPGDLVYYKTPDIPASVRGSGTHNDGYQDIGWLNYYVDDLPVIGGKLRLDGYFSNNVTGSGSISFNPRLVNITDQNVKFWFSSITTVNNYNSANVVLKPKAWVNLDDGIFNGYGENSTMANPSNTNAAGRLTVSQGNTEIVTLDLSLDDKWYRVYYFPIIDNMEQTTAANMNRRIFLSIQRLY